MTTIAAAAPEPAASAPDSPARRRRPGQQTLYAALSAEVRDLGLMRRRYGYYLVLTSTIVTALVGTAVAVVVVGDSWWQLALAAVLGVVVTQAAFLGHDLAHRQVFLSARRSEWATRLAGGLLIGMSYGWWASKHNRHHRAPNQVGRDPDIDPAPVAWTADIARARRGAARRWLTARQGWLFLPLLLVVGLSLHVSGYKALLGWPGIAHRRLELALVTGRLAAYVALLLSVMSPVKAAAFVAVHLAVFGVAMGGAFAPNHIGMPIVPKGATVDFLRRQVMMSRDVTGGGAVSVIMGGLNHQIEHHLFPSMPRPGLRQAVPVVRAFCARHGIPYTERSLAGAYVDIVRHLNRVGHGVADPFTCPVRQQYRPV